MSVVRGVWRTLVSVTREQASAAPSSGRRWAARAIAGVGAAGTCCMLYFIASAIFNRGVMTVRVKRTDLVVSIVGDGAVESGNNLEIKCHARGGHNIRQIVPDGSIVGQGDLLVRLDTTPLEDAIAAEKATLAKAEAAMNRAKQNWQAATAAIDEYRDGTFVQQRLQLTGSILNAQQRLAKAERNLLQNQIMFRRGFASWQHVEATQLAVDKARTELASAHTKKDVLEDFTLAKMLEDLAAKRDTAAAQLKSEDIAVRRETAKIQRLEEDLKNCAIRAPRSGMVIYATGAVRGGDGDEQQQPEIYAGARVRQYQTLVRLADLSQMQVKVPLAQDKISQLHRGQRAHVTLLDRELWGEVASVAGRAEPATLVGDGVKKYGVVISLDGGADGLKPGMTAEVEIVIERKQDARVLPALCVLDDGGKPRVRVRKWGRVVEREVLLGIANDALVEVVDGVGESELVILAPERGKL